MWTIKKKCELITNVQKHSVTFHSLCSINTQRILTNSSKGGAVTAKCLRGKTSAKQTMHIKQIYVSDRETIFCLLHKLNWADEMAAMAGLTSALSLGAIWLRPSKMTVFPHLGPLNTQVPISLPWTNRIPLVMIWNITNLLRVKSNRVSPLLGLHLPSHSFTTTSPHADHSSEVVIVGGVLGGECVCVFWLFKRVGGGLLMHECLCVSE